MHGATGHARERSGGALARRFAHHWSARPAWTNADGRGRSTLRSRVDISRILPPSSLARWVLTQAYAERPQPSRRPRPSGPHFERIAHAASARRAVESSLVSAIGPVHAELVAAVLADLERVADLLRGVLPHALVEVIDWSTLTRESSDYPRPERSDIRGDFLFCVRTKHDPPVELRIPFEHQSVPHLQMPLRMGDYSFGAWWASPKGAPLPVLVPVVLHHGEGGWTAARTVHDLLPPELLAIPEVAARVPNAGFFLDDLASLHDDAIAARTRDPALLAMLWLLRDGGDPENLHASLPRWRTALARHLLEDGASLSARALVRYVIRRAAPVTQVAFEDFLHHTNAQAEAAFMNQKQTYGDILIQQGLAQGLSQGLSQGLAQGRAEERARAVLGILGKRGVAVPEAARRQLEACTDLSELERLFDRAFEVTRAEELFTN
jgi:hypothetical protein